MHKATLLAHNTRVREAVLAGLDVGAFTDLHGVSKDFIPSAPSESLQLTSSHSTTRCAEIRCLSPDRIWDSHFGEKPR